MARRKITQIFDDLDGTPLEEEDVRVIRFCINSTEYVLDVSEAHAEEFHAALAPYVKAATKVPGTRSSQRTTANYDPQEVREWAAKNGFTVARRGKIAQEVVDAYLAVNG